MKGYVMITGATSGIGYEMAKLFADQGKKLVLVGRNEQKLQKLLAELGEEAKVVTICQDLGVDGAATVIYEETKRLGIEIEILINNAGAGYVGEFAEMTEEQILQLMQLNMTSLTLLTRYYVNEMKLRKSGKILNVASTGSYHPGPYTALYYATKAYVLSLSEALSEELKPYHVVVSSLCPGATATNFARAAGRSNAKIAMNPAFVAKKAYEGLMKEKRVIIPGLQNWLFVKIPRMLAIKLIKGYQRYLKDERV